MKCHKKAHVSDAKKRGQYKCPHCDKTYSLHCHPEFYSHVKAHLGKLQLPFGCSFCKKSFIQKKELNKHVKTHSKERPFPCNFCDYRAKGQVGLKIHEGKHMRVKPKSFKCSECDQTFTDKSNQIGMSERTLYLFRDQKTFIVTSAVGVS